MSTKEGIDLLQRAHHDFRTIVYSENNVYDDGSAGEYWDIFSV